MDSKEKLTISSPVFERAVELMVEHDRRKRPTSGPWRPVALLGRIARYMGVSVASLYGDSRRRHRDAVRARHLAVTALHYLHPELSLRHVGRILKLGPQAIQNSLTDKNVDWDLLEQFLAEERELDRQAWAYIEARRPGFQALALPGQRMTMFDGMAAPEARGGQQ